MAFEANHFCQRTAQLSGISSMLIYNKCAFYISLFWNYQHVLNSRFFHWHFVWTFKSGFGSIGHLGDMSYNAVNITADKAVASDASIHLIVTKSECCNKNINVSLINTSLPAPVIYNWHRFTLSVINRRQSWKVQDIMPRIYDWRDTLKGI